MRSSSAPSASALASQIGNRAVARAVARAPRRPRGRGMSPHGALVARMAASRTTLQRDDIVGQGKAVDPGDNTCTLTWTLGSGWKYLRPSGVACDPGMAGIKGSGDSAQYPYNDYPDSPSTGSPGIDRPHDCPPERWEGPSRKNMFIGHCRPPGATHEAPIPLPPPVPEQPGDYNVPDPNADLQYG